MSDSEKLVNCGECVRQVENWVWCANIANLGRVEKKSGSPSAGAGVGPEDDRAPCPHFAPSPLARIAEALELQLAMSKPSGPPYNMKCKACGHVHFNWPDLTCSECGWT